eukprot:TRINITY_DN2355_c0_g1_i3.p1 TRINITY_DN2355_c0_g1~~TRINITY_DN2355_c0_g1_i3.p1  ORF type:complete len:121 (-),score=20.01 TRINITY_DN2355_c0_g1_i3:24-386(-)
MAHKSSSRYFWVYTFLWSDYTLGMVPKANNPFIKLVEERTSLPWAAKDFTGILTEKKIEFNYDKLKESMLRDGLEMNDFEVLKMDPDWVFWPARRNAILSKIDHIPESLLFDTASDNKKS